VEKKTQLFSLSLEEDEAIGADRKGGCPQRGSKGRCRKDLSEERRERGGIRFRPVILSITQKAGTNNACHKHKQNPGRDRNERQKHLEEKEKSGTHRRATCPWEEHCRFRGKGTPFVGWNKLKKQNREVEPRRREGRLDRLPEKRLNYTVRHYKTHDNKTRKSYATKK